MGTPLHGVQCYDPLWEAIQVEGGYVTWPRSLSTGLADLGFEPGCCISFKIQTTVPPSFTTLLSPFPPTVHSVLLLVMILSTFRKTDLLSNPLRCIFAPNYYPISPTPFLTNHCNPQASASHLHCLVGPPSLISLSQTFALTALKKRHQWFFSRASSGSHLSPARFQDSLSFVLYHDQSPALRRFSLPFLLLLSVRCVPLWWLAISHSAVEVMAKAHLQDAALFYLIPSF